MTDEADLDRIDHLVNDDAAFLAAETHLVRCEAKPLDSETLFVPMKTLEAVASRTFGRFSALHVGT